MRTICLALALCVAASVCAQEAPDKGKSPSSRPQPAPLESVDTVEPAVDFGAAAKAQSAKAAVPTRQPPAAADGPAPSQAPRRALDTLDLGTTSITGNQELPKVLYIVPWKQSDLGDLVGRPVNTLLDEVLAPLDPAVFERRLDYYEALYGDSEKE